MERMEVITLKLAGPPEKVRRFQLVEGRFDVKQARRVLGLTQLEVDEEIVAMDPVTHLSLYTFEPDTVLNVTGIQSEPPPRPVEWWWPFSLFRWLWPGSGHKDVMSAITKMEAMMSDMDTSIHYLAQDLARSADPELRARLGAFKTQRDELSQSGDTRLPAYRTRSTTEEERKEQKQADASLPSSTQSNTTPAP